MRLALTYTLMALDVAVMARVFKQAPKGLRSHRRETERSAS